MENLIGKIHSFIRFVLFMQGCPLKCKYCHNRDTWDMNHGTEYTISDVVKKVIRSKPYMDNSNGGITISGGEPLLQIDFLKSHQKLKNFYHLLI